MLNAAEIFEAAESHGVPKVDALMIAFNYLGAKSTTPMPRARMQIQPLDSPEHWQMILPLNNQESPFNVADGNIRIGDEPVSIVHAIENDDVVLFYLRAGGINVTLNTFSRSSCVGCVFCPNVIEDAADQLLGGSDRLENLLRWIIADSKKPDLGHVESLTVCTGCFRSADNAISHLRDIQEAAKKFGFSGRIHLLSSVIRGRESLERAASELENFHLTLTLECFERRDLLLKETKSSLTLDGALDTLSSCKDLGIIGDFTYVAGLDSREAAISGLRRLAECSTTFPRIQVYQAHNDYMRFYQSPDLTGLDYFFDIRSEIEGVFAREGLTPVSWENYRPLWYTKYDGRDLGGPRT